MNINWEPQETSIITHLDNVVLTTRYDYRNCWRDRDDEYWFERIREEIDELRMSISGQHDDSVDHELVQIASICMNWLDMRAGPQGCVQTKEH